jgi:hypothetical protein
LQCTIVSLKPYHRWSPLDKFLTWNAVMLNDIFPHVLLRGGCERCSARYGSPKQGTQDYFGFNYYTSNRVTFDLRKPESMFSNGFFTQKTPT